MFMVSLVQLLGWVGGYYSRTGHETNLVESDGMENGNMFTNFLCVFYVSINFSCLCRNKPVLLPHYCHKYVCIYIYNGFHLVTKAKIILFFLFCMFPTFTVCFVCEFLKFIYFIRCSLLPTILPFLYIPHHDEKYHKYLLYAQAKCTTLHNTQTWKKLKYSCDVLLLCFLHQKGHKVYHLI